MLNNRIIKYSIIFLIPLFLIAFGLLGCIKVHPEGQREAGVEEVSL